ncbi:DEAD/DEAH box helicase [Kribbella sp. WER1]
MTLTEKLPGTTEPDDLFDAFQSWVGEQGISLYPAQEEALIEVMTGSNVILSTPTGSGKSLVATGAHFAALANGQRTFYTAPIKALVSEKFFALCDIFGADKVGMLTGDAAVNASAPIICCTAEVLANIALREGSDADIGQVVMDEFHFYSEPDRGWAWQVPLLELPKAQFVLMSATLGDVERFKIDLSRRTGRSTAIVASGERPVPLIYKYVTTALHETLEELLTTHQAPVYVVHFTQAAALERAQALMSINVSSKEEKEKLNELIGNFRFSKGFGRTLQRLVKHGIGVHHAGMLPKYRRLVEQIAQAGLLKVICGTDTLGVGINVPIRTVVLTALSKYDGRRQRILKAREFHQIAGRAGRAGYDTSGTVVVQAPDHVVENVKALAKAGDDPKKQRKVQRKKPPEGFVTWGEDTFDRLVAAEPEALQSRMRVSHAMLLNVIARDGNAFESMRQLLRDNHEDARSQVRLIRRAIQIYRTLVTAGVVERLDEPDENGRILRLTVDLQKDFSLNQPLSTFALAALDLLDPADPSYALDVVSIIEATLEDPRAVLWAQEHHAKGEAVNAMKAQGIEYDERMELLEDVSWPKPLQELLEATFEMYRQTHPWIADTGLSPKAVVRDMFERAMTFGEFIGYYGLARSEGIVLRYLSDAYKALRQTVPPDKADEDLADLIEWLGEVVRQTDSSLLDEWEELTNPADDTVTEVVPAGPRRITLNTRAFRVLVRNAMFRRVELLALHRWAELGQLDGEAGWDAGRWAEAGTAYYAEHEVVGTGPEARGPALFLVEEHPGYWEVQQIIDDPEGNHDWRITASVDLAASDEAAELVLELVSFKPL